MLDKYRDRFWSRVAVGEKTECWPWRRFWVTTGRVRLSECSSCEVRR